ncbi:MAG: proton-conducting transporter membrane subunit, partial [Bacteroidales bacterium]
NLMQHAGELDPFWLKLSFVFFLLGFSIKMSFIPMYTASIDAKDKAPAPAGAILASMLMNAGFISVYRYYAILCQTPLKSWAQSLLLISALISLFIAAVYMTRVKNIKRMLAYSGIEHMSLMIIGIILGKTGTYAAILHMVLHSIIKPALFFQYNQIYWVYQSKSIYDIGNYFKYNKAGATALLIGIVSITAIPPSGLFVSEIILFQSLFSNHMLTTLLIVLILLTIIIWGLFSNVMKILFTPPLQINENAIPAISPWESTTQYILPLLAMYLAYFQPGWFIDWINKAIIL